MDTKEIALKRHKEWRGKIEVASRVRVTNAEELAVARADAGRLAPSALLHFLVARGIVFCYRRMAPRPAPDPATEKPAP